MRVHLMVMLHPRHKVTLLALLTVYPNLVHAFVPASHALSSVSHEVTPALTMEQMLAFQPYRASRLVTSAADLAFVVASMLHHNPIYGIPCIGLLSQLLPYITTHVL